jgi:hypothetical protein
LVRHRLGETQSIGIRTEGKKENISTEVMAAQAQQRQGLTEGERVSTVGKRGPETDVRLKGDLNSVDQGATKQVCP